MLDTKIKNFTEEINISKLSQGQEFFETKILYLKKMIFILLTGNKYYYSSLFSKISHIQSLDIISDVINVYLEELTKMMGYYNTKSDRDMSENLQKTATYFFECLV